MMRTKILDVFPPPEFLNFPYVGLQISENFIRCIKFGKKNNELYIEKYAERPLPLGVVTAGHINGMDEVTQALIELKKELNIKYVKVSLPEENAYLFKTKIPNVERNEIRSTIEFKIEENVPLPASEIIFDYILIPSTTPQDDHMSVVVSALPATIIDMYLEILNTAGLKVLSFEIASQAIARAVLPSNTQETHLIMHFGFEKVGFYIVVDNIVHFTYTVSTKGESLDNPAFLGNEIKKTCAYWNSPKEDSDKKVEEQGTINSIIACGEIFGETILPYLSSQINIPIVLGNVWVNVLDIDKSIPPISFVDSLKYAPAIGLALPSEILI